ncbi:type II secretion system protein [Pyrobaculum islandicum DSM 4184]|uniref:Type II secretion system protein n=1 Tax=Pyrobaculum islandicum (strain DSM 4184 / JCM 9189 / GEO3) TaxID=384616 RepID=A1RUD1_PYRIL|nr:type II secretion system F family protein [Pyrobaculum islandicum]ABL88563.1 type II secretion system protein [Pyrobaculum islandicum DSM 4184]
MSDFLVFVLVGLVLAGVGFGGWRRAVYVYRLEGQIPQVLRVLSDAVSAGLSLRGAVESAAALALRPMADVLRRVLTLSEVGGLTVEEALWRVAGEVPSPNFRRFALIVTEAARSGARLPEVLDVSARSFATVVEFRQSVASQLRPYVALYYAIVVVLAVLTDVLIYMLLPQLAQMMAAAPAQGGIKAAVLDKSAVLRALYLSGFAGVLVGGLVVGRVVYNSARAGLLHAGVGAVVLAVGLWAPAWMGY